MNKNYPRKITDIKGALAVRELQRTHYIVAVLALGLAFVLTMTIFEPIQFDGILGFAAIALLIILAAMSLATAIGLKKNLKK